MYTGFSKEEDRAKAEAFFKVRVHHELITRRPQTMLTFFQDKDISTYNQALAQVLDGISAKAAFIKVRENCSADTLLL